MKLQLQSKLGKGDSKIQKSLSNLMIEYFWNSQLQELRPFLRYWSYLCDKLTNRDCKFWECEVKWIKQSLIFFPGC